MGNYLAWDPGETTGWALFNGAGVCQAIGEATYGRKLWFTLMGHHPVDFYVYEEFRNRPRGKKEMRYMKYWDKVIAARAIGFIEMRAIMLDIPVYPQEPAIKPLTAQAFNLPNDRDHMMNAVLHGLHYAKANLGLLPGEHLTTAVQKPIEPRHTTVVTASGLGDIAKLTKKQTKKSTS